VKILVIGGTGFIGSHVLERLAETGHRVRCLVRMTSDTRLAERAGAELVPGDVTDRESVRRATEGCDAVINLANIFEFWLRKMSDFRAVNVEGTRNVMEAALEAGVQKVVYVSTLCVYGDTSDRIITERSVPGRKRHSAYARTKYEGDLLAWELHRNRGLPLVVVYPAAVTGPGDAKPCGRYIESIVKRKMPAEVLRERGISWVHVRDVAEIIVRALEKDGNVGERYIAASEWLSFGDLNRLVAAASGAPVPRLVLPDPLVLAGAGVLTVLGRLFRFSPMLGMSLDQIRTMRLGFRADGSKAARELGITYAPASEAVREAVEHILRTRAIGKPVPA
jgi:dihydroflavonol-4-reductase